MSLNNPFESPRKPSKIEGVLGRMSPDYAEGYYPQMSVLKERIAANMQILETTRDAKEMQLLGKIIQRDQLALLQLKKEHGISPTQEERMAA